MNDTSLLLWGTLFGGIGLGFFLYGKKQKAIIPLVVGIALSVLPYFIYDVYIMVIAGLALMALPRFVKI